MSLLWPADSWLYWLACAAVLFVFMGLLKRDEDRVPRARRRYLIWACISAVAVAGFSPTLAFALRGGDVGEFDAADFALVTGAGLVGVASLFLGAWAVFGDRARGRRRCPKCWYDLSGSPGLTCSECGHTAKADRALLRTRRKKWWAAAAVVLAMGSAGMASWSWYRHETWQTMIPTTALILAVPWLDGNTEMGKELITRMQSSAVKPRGVELPRWQKRMLASRTGALLSNPNKFRAFEFGCDLARIQGRSAAKHLPLLTSLNNHPDDAVRGLVPEVLATIVADPAEAAALIAPYCADAAPTVRQEALGAMRWRGVETGGRLLPPKELLAATEDADANCRGWALLALTSFLPTPDSLATIHEHVQDRNLQVSRCALIALAVTAPDDPGLVPALDARLRSDDPFVRWSAVSAMEIVVFFSAHNKDLYMTGTPGPYVGSLVVPLVQAMAADPKRTIIGGNLTGTSQIPVEWTRLFLEESMTVPRFRREGAEMLVAHLPQAREVVPRLREMLAATNDEGERKDLEEAIRLLDRDSPSVDRTP